ncbi:MAG TPA: hypothetical protein VMJ64_11785 [Anaerolineales bacterium]|nr:hypothetical protein [Anaerolineales bacterium]
MATQTTIQVCELIFAAIAAILVLLRAPLPGDAQYLCSVGWHGGKKKR